MKKHTTYLISKYLQVSAVELLFLRIPIDCCAKICCFLPLDIHSSILLFLWWIWWLMTRKKIPQTSKPKRKLSYAWLFWFRNGKFVSWWFEKISIRNKPDPDADVFCASFAQKSSAVPGTAKKRLVQIFFFHFHIVSNFQDFSISIHFEQLSK